MSDDNRNIEVKYEFGDKKFEGRGHPDDINPHVALFASLVAPTTEHGVIQLRLPEAFDKGDDAPRLEDKSASNGKSDESLSANKESSKTISNNGHNDNQKTELPDLPSFYLSLNITKQVEQPASILFWYKEQEGIESLKREDFIKAFGELKKAGIKPPDEKELKQMLDNATYVSKYLYRTDDGGYGLTIPGRKHIQKIKGVASE